jgi:hypothetical protein
VKELQDILREARSLPDEFTALAAVVLRARDCLDSGEAQLIALDTRALFGCDGLIEILIERRPLCSENPLLQQLAHSFAHWKSSAITAVFQTTEPDDLPLGSIATSCEDRYRSRDFLPLREICRAEAIKALAQVNRGIASSKMLPRRQRCSCTSCRRPFAFSLLVPISTLCGSSRGSNARLANDLARSSG